jgi:hypothetical protein
VKQIQLKGCSHTIRKHNFFKLHGIRKIKFMGTNVKSVCPRRLHEIIIKKCSNIVASMNSTVIYSYLSRKWIRILPPKQSIKNFSQRKTLYLTFTFGGNWLRCKYKTSSVESSTVQHLDSVRVAQQSDQKSAKFEIRPVWSQMNPGLQ